MAFDIILSGGLVVDGTGDAPRLADVGIEGDRIIALGDLSAATAGERVDCAGRAVAPGFIDIHTHYDPQILWDPELTPSSWYGVTTAIMGNCGFTIAPMRPASRKTCIEILGNVEAMSVEALTAGISWEFESFAEYLRAIERRRPALNVGALVGHTALRLYELEGDAVRPATEAEIRGMQGRLEEAMAAGAWGFSTSKSQAHVGAGGRPVPSRLASTEEILQLGQVLSSGGAGIVQGVTGPGLSIQDFAEIARRSGRPVTWCSLHQGVEGGRHWDLARETAAARAKGADLWAQMGCLPIVSQFTLDRPYVLNAVPAFGRIAGLPRDARLAMLSDTAWQAEAEAQIDGNVARLSYRIRWDRMAVSESAAHPELVGRTVAEIAGPGRSPLATMVEIVQDDGLQTRFKLIMFNDDEAEVARLLSQDLTLLGLGDAGAHASQLCDASFPLHLLSRFVRQRRDFSLEYAIWRLTGHPAQIFGVAKRGTLRPGYHADICIFDPETIGESSYQRVHDFPAGADRLIKHPIGMEHVMVNGAFIRRAGAQIEGVGAGRVLRP